MNIIINGFQLDISAKKLLGMEYFRNNQKWTNNDAPVCLTFSFLADSTKLEIEMYFMFIINLMSDTSVADALIHLNHTNTYNLVSLLDFFNEPMLFEKFNLYISRLCKIGSVETINFLTNALKIEPNSDNKYYNYSVLCELIIELFLKVDFIRIDVKLLVDVVQMLEYSADAIGAIVDDMMAAIMAKENNMGEVKKFYQLCLLLVQHELLESTKNRDFFKTVQPHAKYRPHPNVHQLHENVYSEGDLVYVDENTFYDNLVLYSCGLLTRDFLDYINGKNYVLAGSFMYKCLSKKAERIHINDIDIFYIGKGDTSTRTKNEFFFNIVGKIKTFGSKNGMHVNMSKTYLEVTELCLTNPQMKNGSIIIQLISTGVDSPESVIYSFDLDNIKTYYYHSLYVDKLCIFAQTYNTHIMRPFDNDVSVKGSHNTILKKYYYRLYKYYNEKLLGIYCFLDKEFDYVMTLCIENKIAGVNKSQKIFNIDLLDSSYNTDFIRNMFYKVTGLVKERYVDQEQKVLSHMVNRVNIQAIQQDSESPSPKVWSSHSDSYEKYLVTFDQVELNLLYPYFLNKFIIKFLHAVRNNLQYRRSGAALKFENFLNTIFKNLNVHVDGYFDWSVTNHNADQLLERYGHLSKCQYFEFMQKILSFLEDNLLTVQLKSHDAYEMLGNGSHTFDNIYCGTFLNKIKHNRLLFESNILIESLVSSIFDKKVSMIISLRHECNRQFYSLVRKKNNIHQLCVDVCAETLNFISNFRKTLCRTSGELVGSADIETIDGSQRLYNDKPLREEPLQENEDEPLRENEDEEDEVDDADNFNVAYAPHRKILTKLYKNSDRVCLEYDEYSRSSVEDDSHDGLIYLCINGDDLTINHKRHLNSLDIAQSIMSSGLNIGLIKATMSFSPDLNYFVPDKLGTCPSYPKEYSDNYLAESIGINKLTLHLFD